MDDVYAPPCPAFLPLPNGDRIECSFHLGHQLYGCPANVHESIKYAFAWSDPDDPLEFNQATPALAAHFPRDKYLVIEDEAGWKVFTLDNDPSFT